MRKYIALILSLTFVLALVGCDSKDNKNTPNFAEEYKDYGGTGLVLGLVNGSDPTENGVVYVDAIDDVLTVQFANLTDSDSEYILKLFVDYEETPFYYQNERITQYVFDVTAGASVELPISLPSETVFKNSRMLTVAILTAPDKHACDIDLMSNSYGVVLSYELAQREQLRKIQLNSKPMDAELYQELSFQGVMLNTDFDTTDDSATQFPPKQLNAKAGEEVTLAYRVGNYEKTKELLVVVLVDWVQQEVNGAKYIHLVNNEGFVGYGTIRFIAPTIPGKYEIVAFAVDNPSLEKNYDTFHTHETAYRFTLVVE